MKLETPDAKRPYRQTARAAAAEATAARILEVFRRRLQLGWFEEIRLEDVAREAGVAVQTVIRRFGGKDGLLEATVGLMDREIRAYRGVPEGDAAAVARAVVEDYEVTGDLVMRVLAQEDRYPALRRMADTGRGEHRAWLAAAFARWIDPLPPDQARRRLDALVAATDVYIWRLIRRDMRRPVAEYVALVEQLVQTALALP